MLHFAEWRCCLLALLVTAFNVAASAAEQKLFVSPNGNDASSGKSNDVAAGNKDGPVKTIGRAQQLARSLVLSMRSKSEPIQAIKVILLPGEYPLRSALVFEPADSGFAGAPVVYEAQTPGSAVISGGLRLDVKSVDNNLVTFNAPADQPMSILGGGQLFVQGKRAVLARMPDEGKYWFVEKPLALAAAQGEPGREAFVPEKAANDWLAGIPPTERARAIVNVMQSWSAGRHRLADNTPPGAVKVRPAANWPFLKFGQSQRFFVENVSTALDKPGEWFWNADEIRYIPRSGERPDAIEVVLPMLDKLLEVRGQPGQNTLVEHLHFKGIAFRHTRSLTPRDGFFDVQAGVNIGAAIEVNGARDIRFEACKVSLVSGYGIWFKKAVRDSVVVGSVLTDLGAGGVKLGLPEQAPGDPNGTGSNAVSGNTITETGKVYVGAVGVWVGQSFDNEIAYNTIANTTYSGISVGWKWGYGEPRSGRNRIVGNLLSNIGQGMLDDMGAIYHLGEAPGTVIANNLIREVRAYKGYGPGSWGIYLDEGSSNIAVENNIVLGTDSGAVHLHYGRTNIIANNVFASGAAHELLVTRSDPALTKLAFKNNLIVSGATQLFGGFANGPDVQFMGNQISASLAKKPVDLAACGKGCSASQATITTGNQPRAVKLINADRANTQMVDRVTAQAGRLPPDRLVKLGATVLPASAGAELALTQARQAPVFAPVKDFVVSFDMTADNMRPIELNYEPKDDKRAVRILKGNDIPGGACLLFDDGPQYANKYEPFASTKLDYETGEVVGKFSIRFEPGSEFIYEWRDGSKPYQSGPWLRISAKGLETQQKVLTKLNPGQWYGLEIAAPLGDKAGSWRLQVSDGKSQPLVFDSLAVKSSQWKQLKWVGFIADGVVKAETCVGQIQVLQRK